MVTCGELGHLLEVLQWRAHRGAVADPAAQGRLVQHHPELGRHGPREDLLAAHPERDPALDLLGRAALGGRSDHRAGVVLGLEQARDVLDLVRTDHRRVLLQPEVVLEPVGHHIAVVVPPAGRVGLPGQREHGLALGLLDHAVEGEQVGHIAQLETGPPSIPGG